MKNIFKTFVIALLLLAGTQNVFALTKSFVVQDSSNTNLYNATLYGEVTNSSVALDSWIEINLGSGITSVGRGSHLGEYSAYVTGLQCDTTYNYQAVLSWQGERIVGSIENITTGACGNNNNNNNISVTTNSATSIGQTYATLNGYTSGSGSAWFGTNLGNGSVTVGNTTANGNYSYNLSGLTCNTTYQYYAGAQGSNSQVYGSVVSFTTSACNGNNNNNNNLRAITTAATGVGYTSARLNGIAIPYSSPVNSYFEYGTTQNLGYRTTSKTYYESNSAPVLDVITGLSQGTTYYFRTVAEKDGQKAYGDIMSFRTYVYEATPTTTTTVTPVKTVTTTNTVKTNTNTTTSNQGIVYIPVQLGSVQTIGNTNVGISSPTLGIISVTKGAAGANCEADYKITYTNTSSSTLSNVLVNVVLPNELAFVRATEGQYRETDNTLAVPVGTMAAGESRSLTVTAKVLSGAQVGKTVSVTSYLNYTSAQTGAQDQAVGYTLLTINDSCDTTVIGGTSGAGAVGLASFLPSNLFQWLLLVIAIVIIILAARSLFSKKAE